MALFPFLTPQSNDEVIRTTCKLYALSIFKISPISLTLILVINFFLFGEHLFPAHYAYLHAQVAIFVAVSFLPLSATLCYALEKIGKNEPISYGNLIVYMMQRFIPLAGCFFSMLLIPALVMGVCAAIYFFLDYLKAPAVVLFACTGISFLLVFAVIVSNLMAPILVFTDNFGANESIDENERLIKGNYLRNLVFCLLAGLILLLFSVFSYLLVSYFPILRSQPAYIPYLIGQVLLLFIGPWSFALLITLKNDLQIRHPAKNKSQKTQTKVKAPFNVPTQKNNDQDKFNF